MVQHLDIDQRQRLPQVAGQQLVRLTGLRHARGMVVGEDHRCGVARQRFLDDFAWIDAGLGEGSAKGLFGAHDLVLRIQPNAHEYFVLAMRKREPQVIAYRARRSQGVS